jgi:hypothetical protein
MLANAGQGVLNSHTPAPTDSPTPAPTDSPTNIPTFRPSDVPTTAPTRASDDIATTTTPPTAIPTAFPVEFPALEESPGLKNETPNNSVGNTKGPGGLGPGFGTALGAGLFVLIGGVFFLRRKGKKDDEADATTAQPTDLEGGSSSA